MAAAALTGLLATGASLEAPSAAEAVETKAAAFRASGRTSQNRPVSLIASSRLTSLVRFSISFRARCRNGLLVSSASTESVPVRRGRTGRTFRRSAPGSFPLDGGLTANARATTTGRLSSSGSTGTFRLSATVVNAQGAAVDTCNTGTIRFRVSRR